MKKILHYKGIVVPLVIVLACGLFAFTGCSEDDDNDRGIRVNLTILQTTDMHDRVAGYGQHTSYSPDTLNDDSVLGGFARMAAKTDEIRDAQTASNIPVLLLDSGDYTMGTVYDLLWDSDPAPFAYLQYMEYDAVTLGNHEFDYNPGRLATMITAAQSQTESFEVPIVASNMVFDGTDGDDDALEALQTSGDIVTKLVKDLDNGIKVGIIGLLGKTADEYVPSAAPVTFNSDYAEAAEAAAVQAVVDELRDTDGVDIVIALSHSGLTDVTPSAPAGDDVTLAENVSGIDIILSGHEHKMTGSIVSVTNTTTGHVSRIVCAGAYTRNLAQLDLEVSMTQNSVAGARLTNHTIDDTILGDTDVNTMVADWDAAINAMSLDYDVEDTVATTVPALSGSSPGENGLGSLIADAFRYVGTSGATTFGGCANGTIRNSFAAGQDISFADLFALQPLGMTWMGDQTTLMPGYPLLKVYVYGDEVWDICGFNAKIIQYYTALPSYSEYFVNLSGLQYTYNTSYAVTDVNAYAYDDYACTGSVSDIDDDESTLYPMIIDSYVMSMLLSDSIQSILTAMGFSIEPKLLDETPIDEDNMDDARLEQVAGGDVDEYQCWQAFADYLTDELSGTIPNDPYGSDLGRINP